MRITDEYLQIRKDGTGWRIERRRDHDAFWWVVTLLGLLMMKVIVM
ncbi:hypothetical protein SAMN02745823_03767 [Sporobacter termitidis DSM 10068]|uniref:Uncharacterized protein n=1 Tax=Sporobacter termitidis DSM 10068 TaxID=1123282 RepID=A0A1M5ZHV2_9FIRM|nr:hypothetical protein [Sporobacter termitidis]SHI23810.1 hypothetical protein SAMN02745823_03767 [Sporobacter termitidis DSM 10068]